MVKRNTEFSLKLEMQEVLFLGLAFIIAVMVRIGFSSFIPTITTDGVYYSLMGQKLVQEGWLSSLSVYWSPGLPTIIGLFNLIFHDLEFAGRAVAILFGGLIVFPTYLLARNFYNSWVAFFSVGLAVFHPFLIFFSINVFVESPYAFVFLTVILLFWGAMQTGRLGYFAASAVGCAVLFLLRPEALGYMAVFVFLSFMQSILQGEKFLKSFIKIITILILFFLVISPYLLFLKDQMGYWSLTGRRGSANVHSTGESKYSGREKWYGINPETGESLATILYVGEKIKGKKEGKKISKTGKAKINIFAVFKNTIKRLQLEHIEFLPEMIPILMFLLISIGFFDQNWDKKRLQRESYLVGIVGISCLGYALIHVIPRYLVPLLPIFIIWTAKGTMRISQWLKEVAKQRAPSRRFTVLIVCILLFMTFLPKYMRTIKGDFYNQEIVYKTMGKWIENNLGEGLTIMSLKPMTAFYADGKHVYIPWADYDEFLNYVKRKKIDVLVVDFENFKMKRPESLYRLMDKNAVSDNFEAVFELDDINNKVIIYKMKKNDEN